jgi:hypothetical protein
MVRKWEQKAFSKNKGALRRTLKVKKGKIIPVKKLRSAVKKGGKTAKRAQLVLNVRKSRH